MIFHACYFFGFVIVLYMVDDVRVLHLLRVQFLLCFGVPSLFRRSSSLYIHYICFI